MQICFVFCMLVLDGNFVFQTRNCFNRLDPTFCTAGSRPLIIRFEAKQKSSAHVVFRVEGRNGQYTSSAG